MKYVELNKKGDFERWDAAWLAELNNQAGLEDLSDYLLFQNDHVRLSAIGLEAYERVPFKKITHNHNIVCLTGGLVISRCSDGTINLLNFGKGEKVSHSPREPGISHDFQNIGEELLVLVLIEFLPSFSLDQYPYGMLEGILQSI